MWGSIKYNLANLTNLQGRDARQTFWFYVLFLFLVNIAVSVIISVPLMIGSMGSVFTAAGQGATPDQINAAMMTSMSDVLRPLLWLSVITNLVFVLLLLAAFVRRLHDSDHSGYWAVAMVIAVLAGLAVTISMMNDMGGIFDTMAESISDPENMSAALEMQQQVSAKSIVGWIGPIIVIVFGVMKSTAGPNRYGDAPVQF